MTMKTIRELSEELHVSKQSVWNEIDRQGLRSKLSKDGQTVKVDGEAEELIKSAFQKRQTVKRQETVRQVDGKVADKLPSSGQVDLTVDWQRLMVAKDEQIASLSRQNELLLAQIDKLSSEHQKTVSELTAALENVTQSLKASQALHAGTIAGQLETKEEPLPASAPEPMQTEETRSRRPWWKFW